MACQICSEPFPGTIVCRISCGHLFHTDCFMKWFYTGWNTKCCPTCREQCHIGDILDVFDDFEDGVELRALRSATSAAAAEVAQLHEEKQALQMQLAQLQIQAGHAEQQPAPLIAVQPPPPVIAHNFPIENQAELMAALMLVPENRYEYAFADLAKAVNLRCNDLLHARANMTNLVQIMDFMLRRSAPSEFRRKICENYGLPLLEDLVLEGFAAENYSGLHGQYIHLKTAVRNHVRIAIYAREKKLQQRELPKCYFCDMKLVYSAMVRHQQRCLAARDGGGELCRYGCGLKYRQQNMEDHTYVCPQVVHVREVVKRNYQLI